MTTPVTIKTTKPTFASYTHVVAWLVQTLWILGWWAGWTPPGEDWWIPVAGFFAGFSFRHVLEVIDYYFFQDSPDE